MSTKPGSTDGRARPRLAVAAIAVVAAGALTGCGVAEDTGFQPGMAAQVGDTRISLDAVNDAAQDRCEVLAELSAGQGGDPIPGALVRDVALQGKVLREVADQLAEEYDVETGAAYAGALDAIESQLVDVDRELRERAADDLASTDYFIDMLTAVGRADLGLTEKEDRTGEQGFSRGLELAQAWVAEHDIQVNPRFSQIRIGSIDEGIERTGSDLSVAVSDLAGQAASVTSGDANAATVTDYAASLPASQTCGGA